MSVFPILRVSYWTITATWSTLSATNKTIVRFYPNNLTTVDQPPSPSFSQTPNNIAYDSGAYYVGFYDSIVVVDSSNMSQIQNISTNSSSTTRDMIFLNGGQQMIVASWGNNRLVFFNRSSPVFHSYDYIGYQAITCPYPYGLFRVNDTFFYVTSQDENTVFKYSNTGNITSWAEDACSQCIVGCDNPLQWLSCFNRQEWSLLVLSGSIWNDDLWQPRIASWLLVFDGLHDHRRADYGRLRDLFVRHIIS